MNECLFEKLRAGWPLIHAARAAGIPLSTAHNRAKAAGFVFRQGRTPKSKTTASSAAIAAAKAAGARTTAELARKTGLSIQQIQTLKKNEQSKT